MLSNLWSRLTELLENGLRIHTENLVTPSLVPVTKISIIMSRCSFMQALEFLYGLSPLLVAEGKFSQNVQTTLRYYSFSVRTKVLDLSLFMSNQIMQRNISPPKVIAE